jgi:predicted peptidase
VSELAGLAEEKFVYIAAGGDPKASAGQTEVQGMLDDAGVANSSATWDATWSTAKQASAAAKLFSAGNSINFATFAEGTVLPDGESAGMGGEHMASFEPAYKVEAARDWLFEQRA